MAKTARKTAALVAVAMVLGSVAHAQAEDDVPGTGTLARLRTHSADLTRIISGAMDRSATFRALVDAIASSDGIVFVEPGRCPHGARACLMPSVTVAGANRILHARVDIRKADWDLMGSIGHELQHALEVLAEPSITSGVAMIFFYEREGGMSGRLLETRAAVETGERVRAEVRKPL